MSSPKSFVLPGYGRYDAGVSEDDVCSEDSGCDPLRHVVSPASLHSSESDQCEIPVGKSKRFLQRLGFSQETFVIVLERGNMATLSGSVRANPLGKPNPSVTVFPLTTQREVPKIYRTIIKSGGKTTFFLPVLSMVRVAWQ